MIYLRSHCDITMGVVKSATVALDANGSRRYFPVIEYPAFDGEKYNLETNIGKTKTPGIGSSVKVLYEKGNPRNAIIASGIYPIILGFLYSMAVIIFLICNLIKLTKFIQ